MEPVVEECPPSGARFEAVVTLLKKAKQTVGFLPDAAVRDRAERGTLLIATVGRSVIGYALYDLPRHEIRVRQLVVDPSHRGRGVARQLVETVAQRHPSHRGIRLECRRDFAAHRVWPALGFIPIGERAGRGVGAKPLTIWWLDFAQPNLLTALAESDVRPIAVLDANVVIDLADGAPTASRHLLDDWISGSSRLAVTDEMYLELEKQDDRAARKRHKQFASFLEQVAAPKGQWASVETRLLEVMARAEGHRTDIRHSAKAAAAGARWFVTRDERFRRVCGPTLKSVVDLDVVSPSAFLLDLDRLARGDLYRPADLQATDISVRELYGRELDLAARAFVNQRAGERLSVFRDRLNQLVADPRNHRAQVFESGGDFLALVVTGVGVPLTVPICRVRGALQATLARHVLAWLRTLVGADSRCPVVHLADSCCGEWLEGAFPDEGFLPTAGGGRTAIVLRGAGSLEDLRRAIGELIGRLDSGAVPTGLAADLAAAEPSAPTAYSLEQVFSPYSILGAGLPTFVVPIRAAWAAELVDAALARDQLFPRRRGLALQREHVYYRSPRAAGGLRAPGRILWYVSGQAPGAQAIRAASHLDDVVIGDPRRLHRRFAHLGVYSHEQVEAASHAGQVMALRFSQTRLLRPAPSLDRYRHLVRLNEPGRGVTLTGPQPVTEHMFEQLTTVQS